MNETLKYPVFQANLEDFAALLKGSPVPTNSIIVRYNSRAPRKLEFGVHWPLLERTLAAMEHIDKILTAGAFSDTENVRFSFVFQIEDKSIDVPSASWETKASYKNVCLVPDLYYTLQFGYEHFLANGVPEWEARQSKVLWRGTTTGALYFNREALPTLPRYRLCAAAKAFGHAADVRFYSVVQTAAHEREAVFEHLMQAGMLGDWVEIDQFAHYKYVVQIGGNATSWGLVQKLRLGACMLFVEGAWQNWHERYLEPWVHYIPVQDDLSDFAEKLRWCYENDADAREIGKNCRALGVALDYATELKTAAEDLQKHFVNSEAVVM